MAVGHPALTTGLARLPANQSMAVTTSSGPTRLPGRCAQATVPAPRIVMPASRSGKPERVAGQVRTPPTPTRCQKPRRSATADTPRAASKVSADDLRERSAGQLYLRNETAGRSLAPPDRRRRQHRGSRSGRRSAAISSMTAARPPRRRRCRATGCQAGRSPAAVPRPGEGLRRRRLPHRPRHNRPLPAAHAPQLGRRRDRQRSARSVAPSSALLAALPRHRGWHEYARCRTSAGGWSERGLPGLVAWTGSDVEEPAASRR